MVNVCHTVPQASKYGSGVPRHSQHQRLAADGCQSHSGQRMPPSPIRWLGSRVVTMTGSAERLFAKTGADIDQLYKTGRLTRRGGIIAA